MRKFVLICMGIFFVASAAVAQDAREIPEDLVNSASSPEWGYKQEFRFNVGEKIGTFTGPNPDLDECENKVFRILDQIPDSGLRSMEPDVSGRAPQSPRSVKFTSGTHFLRMVTDPLPIFLGFGGNSQALPQKLRGQKPTTIQGFAQNRYHNGQLSQSR